MTVLTFREDLYDGFALDEAAKTYARVATFELEKAEGVYRVSLSALAETGSGSRFDETVIALEFQNFALGATIDRSRSGRGGAENPVRPGSSRGSDEREGQGK